MTYCFLLGGRDLEMKVIRGLLEELQIPFIDLDLRWKNADLSQYVKEIEQHSSHSISYFAIELAFEGNSLNIKDDYSIPIIPFEDGRSITLEEQKIYVIDHHNANSHKTSALEQIIELLKNANIVNAAQKEQLLNILQENKRRYELVAANDSRYIPGMYAICATDKEVQSIREEEWQIQGVENEIIEKTRQFLKDYIESSTMDGAIFFKEVPDELSITVIRDETYNVAQELVLYTQKGKFEVYGYHLPSIFETDVFGDHKDAMYYGGGEYGFMGLKNPDLNTATDLFQAILNVKKGNELP